MPMMRVLQLMYWVLGLLVMPIVRVLHVMRRVLPPLVMPTVRMVLVMVLLMPTARTLHLVGCVDGEGAVGNALGAIVADDADGEGVAGDASGDVVSEGGAGGAPGVGVAGDANGEGAAGDAPGVGAAGVAECEGAVGDAMGGVAGDALMVRMLQGMLPLALLQGDDNGDPMCSFGSGTSHSGFTRFNPVELRRDAVEPMNRG